ncbi:Hypothetical protein R9X50_00182900 [Acrodontium crateriforme]|uniref:Uncharacterized protein n=1 Tax=Acrodontium crateriforme TaxID=150365 RepID=A0AAQ3R8I1_9PEZI|nr:Hypothetical protein R9X50_00182900 [Acrodontium crateriforme]
MAQPSPRSLAASLEKFTLAEACKTKKACQPTDSWEDEADNAVITTESSSGRESPAGHPGPPPPTPASPRNALSPVQSPKSMAATSPYQVFPSQGPNGQFDPSHYRSPTAPVGSEERRPEKSTAVASRLIAAGLGVKAPRRTKEEREYDQAMRLQEKKKRDQIKEEEERRKKEAEKAKQAIWDD